MSTKALTPAALKKAPTATYADWIANGWTDEQLAREGYIFGAPASAVLTAGPRTPVVLPNDPLETARKFLKAQHSEYTDEGEGPTLLWWREEFYRFTDKGAWEPVEPIAIHSQVWHYLERERTTGLQPTDRNANEVLKALKGLTLLPDTVDAPCWHQERRPLTEPVIICRNGILYPEQIGNASALQGHTPSLFTLTALPVEYDPTAPDPIEWLKFLQTLWPDDPESIDALQEVFGLLLADDMTFQKIFLMVGPARSGKGTILRVIRALLGADTVASPTLTSLGGEFGLQPLIGKLAALIGDARSGKGERQVAGTERLLTISGGDSVDINRKNRPFWSGRLAVRFVLASNLIPEFADAAGVIATRFVVLRLRQSFLGREDPTLFDRLCRELPGILCWALAGRYNLYKRGHFQQPASALEDIEQIRDLAAPVAAFVRDCCAVTPEATEDKARLFNAWREYCGTINHRPGTHNAFSADLFAVFPTVRSVRPRHGAVDSEARPRVYEGIKLNDPAAGGARAASITTGPSLTPWPPPVPPLPKTAAPLCVHGWGLSGVPCPTCGVRG